MSEIEAAVFGPFLPIKCPDEKVKFSWNIIVVVAVTVILKSTKKRL